MHVTEIVDCVFLLDDGSTVPIRINGKSEVVAEYQRYMKQTVEYR
ncbi:hypothetical protein JS532_05580 [Bifidobacterium callimiconis]|nr:hypothetical protein [Bifidobacterium callimiconis]